MMTEPKPMVYLKLIRDKIPQIIKAKGKAAHVRKIRGRELKDAVGRKILEETFELFDEWQKENRDDILKESADVLEIVLKALSVHGFTLDDLLQRRQERAADRGAFEEQFFLDQVGGSELIEIQTSKQPAMVFNPTQQKELLWIIRSELKLSRCVRIASAFYSPGATNLMMAELTHFLEAGGDLKVILSTMGNITKPLYFSHFKDNLPGADLRVFHPPQIPLEQSPPNFHVKTWLFEHHDGQGAFIIGSSNLTRKGLSQNIEWNYYSAGEVNLSFDGKDSPLSSSINEFERVWKDETTQITDDFLKAYDRRRKSFETKPDTSGSGEFVVFEDVTGYNPLPESVWPLPAVSPNSAQQEALINLTEFRGQGVRKAAVIAATGVGKTYLAAFDFKNSGCRTMLYVAHREDILIKSRETFRRVLGTPEFGDILGRGRRVSEDGEGVFAMIQTLSRNNHLESFLPGDFDYIVIDEFHHAASDSYRRILDYFRPRFLLGLTATPERMDGRNVLAYCNYNIAYEVRVLDAVDRGYLVPFQYYAIYDKTDYSQLTWRGSRYDEKELDRVLENDTRTRIIVRNLKRYLPSSGKIKALAFCSSVSHARYTADRMTRDYNLPAIALWGESGDDSRHEAVERLQNESDSLNVICTVDIFNEGTDIPALSHVLLLRPTQSFTLFLQQMGRGLRKADDKEFLVVLDFVGNFKKVHVAPLALSGYTSLDQFTTSPGTSSEKKLETCLPKGCFLSADTRVRRIWEAEIKKIVSNGMTAADRLKIAYQEIKENLGKDTPLNLMDLMDNPLEVDPCRFLKPNPFGSWLRAKDYCEDGNIPDREKSYMDTPGEYLLRHIEAELKPTKSYKMVVLLSLLQLGGTSWSVDDIAKKFLAHYLDHPDQMSDWDALAGHSIPADFPLSRVRTHLKNMPLEKMSNSDTDCFVLVKKNDQFSLKPEYRKFWNDPFFMHLVKDRVDFVLSRYFKRERLNQLLKIDPAAFKHVDKNKSILRK
jgi:superfamily II DNA or RNA helicase/HKD family nuclease/predicted house-cleaning noncanonical NTP pyrophosphatase (MazG superfamily)